MRAPITLSFALFSALAALSFVSCGGGSQNAKTASGADGKTKPAAGQVHECGKEKSHAYDLHDEDGDDALAPCSASGQGDYSGLVHIETTSEGIKVTIHATDDQVETGALGSDVKNRDAVIVYPKGPGSEAVEVPLEHTPDGYKGEKIIPFSALDKLTDEGTKLDIAVFDYDKSSGQPAEELHIAVNVSAGKSCEKAIDENPQTIDMGGKKGAKADLTNEQLGGPMRTSTFFANCGLSDAANAEICVAVKQGKPIGVSVGVSPRDNKVATCIDKATRRLHWPTSEKLDVVHQKF